MPFTSIAEFEATATQRCKEAASFPCAESGQGLVPWIESPVITQFPSQDADRR